MLSLVLTLGCFALILFLTRFGVPLALSIFAGTVALGFAFGLDGDGMLRGVARGLAAPDTVGLATVIFLLLGLSGLLQSTGQLDRIVKLVGAVFRRPAVSMAALPALIGLLPMPGGALFSAPMVESAAGDEKVEGHVLSAVNFWFRHVWEYWWPLYPGVIVALALTGISLPRFVSFQFPMSVFMIAAGLLILKRIHPSLHVQSDAPPSGSKRSLLRVTAPIWLIIVFWVPSTAVVRAALSSLRIQAGLAGALERLLPIGLGLIVSFAWVVWTQHLGLRTVAKVVFRRSGMVLASLVVSIMVFQHVLKEVGAAERIAADLTALHVPLVLVVIILPFIAGLVTGIAVGFVGTSFPIVLGLVHALPGHGSVAPYVMLAYAAGHMGQMVSPLHLCYVVSNQYFRTSFGLTYREFLPSVVLTASSAILYFVALRRLFG